jgi:hypothetical protein
MNAAVLEVFIVILLEYLETATNMSGVIVLLKTRLNFLCVRSFEKITYMT